MLYRHLSVLLDEGHISLVKPLMVDTFPYHQWGLDKILGVSGTAHRYLCFRDSVLCSSAFNHVNQLCREIAQICMSRWKNEICCKIFVSPPLHSLVHISIQVGFD